MIDVFGLSDCGNDDDLSQANPIQIGEATVKAWFTPGHGEALAQRIATRIGTSKRRIRIASPVLTSAPILGTLAKVLASLRFSGKNSVPWGTGELRNFMHAKVTVVDDTVPDRGPGTSRSGPSTFMGSFNLSRSGEDNAENMVEIEDPAVAEAMVAFIDQTRARYPLSTVPELGIERRA